MRAEQRGQMPGNRATTQQDTLVRNLQNTLVELHQTKSLTTRARTPLDKPRSFTDADRHARRNAPERAIWRVPIGTSVSAPHVEVGVLSVAVGGSRRASRSVVPSRGSGQRARTITSSRDARAPATDPEALKSQGISWGDIIPAFDYAGAPRWSLQRPQLDRCRARNLEQRLQPGDAGNRDHQGARRIDRVPGTVTNGAAVPGEMATRPLRREGPPGHMGFVHAPDPVPRC